MIIHCLQHVAFENPGTILEWAAANQHTVHYTNYFKEDYALPSLSGFDALLIMGGYMNLDEEEQFLWLKDEKQFIRLAIDAGKKVIGICLGSQLIAAALGSKVYPCKEKEIGFFPIEFTEEAINTPLFNHFSNPYTVFHWHGDTFDLPHGAQLIASTDVCKHQAYTIGDKVLALQFHLEMNETVVEDMMKFDGHELEAGGRFVSDKETIRNNSQYLEQNKKDLFILLNKFFNERS